MCIYTWKFSILINDSPKRHFSASNGLRQEDPLSLILFILVTYIFNKILCLGKENNMIRGINFPHYGPNVLNIQCVDYTLLFLELSDEYFINLKRILCCFQASSGWKIIFQKSSLIGIGITNELSKRLSLILGCVQSTLSITYLGLPLNFKNTSYND